MNNIPVKIKKLSKNAVLPTQATQGAAGYDFYADLDAPVEIYPHATAKISSGIAMEIPENYWMGLFARSGLATKEGLRPANCIGE